METIEHRGQPIFSTPEQRSQLADVLQALENVSGQLRILTSDGKELTVPPALVKVLIEAGWLLADEKSLVILPADRDLSPHQAASLLNISRPYLLRILDQGNIPFHRVGTHRRIKLKDVIAFRKRRDAERRTDLKRISDLSRESGIPE